MSTLLGWWAQWLPSLLYGLLTSVEVTVACMLIGIPLGLLFALGVGSTNKLVQRLTVVLVELGRGAPALILLQFFYFGLPAVHITLSSFVSSTLALAWCTAAYTSEIIRAGLLSVPHGQREAAYAIGLKEVDTLKLIILPQGLRVSVPPLLGFALVMLQATSLCFTVALPELVTRANQIGTGTFLYMQVLTLTALLYAAICLPSTLLVSSLERRLARHEA
ncbi:amino acid ABC transporter permease [Paraburkholderia caribensis]|uniref:Amino acid ABC transporter permease n=1 Tax=Paraburkholderia caribensis TaxID=75105 RepID=A0A9Q6S812_9BURK|nr:amino acid ABC transporter permease [Paraburkholderia caribensis]MCO4878272.1 amino acid ABC transporter permease [Paraburkholderia caribensis]PTB28626.1 amino acid ABC transporter permease [Paraburkholderia caribensis]QLB66071.1 amino acid ABC transporter permease [Paraburkholderia caribensis]